MNDNNDNNKNNNNSSGDSQVFYRKAVTKNAVKIAGKTPPMASFTNQDRRKKLSAYLWEDM